MISVVSRTITPQSVHDSKEKAHVIRFVWSWRAWPRSEFKQLSVRFPSNPQHRNHRQACQLEVAADKSIVSGAINECLRFILSRMRRDFEFRVILSSLNRFHQIQNKSIEWFAAGSYGVLTTPPFPSLLKINWFYKRKQHISMSKTVVNLIGFHYCVTELSWSCRSATMRFFCQARPTNFEKYFWHQKWVPVSS